MGTVTTHIAHLLHGPVQLLVRGLAQRIRVRREGGAVDWWLGALLISCGRGRGRLCRGAITFRAGVGVRRRGARWDFGDDLGLPRRRRGHAVMVVPASLPVLTVKTE